MLLVGKARDAIAANVRAIMRTGRSKEDAIRLAIAYARKHAAPAPTREDAAPISDETRSFVYRIFHARMAAGLTSKRHASGRFRPGVSGNPCGRPKGCIPRQLPPTLIINAYARTIRRLVIEPMREAYAPLLRELPALLASAARGDSRADAGESRRAREMLDAAKAEMERRVQPGDLERLATRVATSSQDWNIEQLRRQVRAALGVDPIFKDQRLASLVDNFVHENVALIKSIPMQLHTEIEAMVLRGISEGTIAGNAVRGGVLSGAVKPQNLAEQISKRFGVSEKRAKVIARDQIGKIVGQINATRQREMGVKKFIWRTVGDNRVRGYRRAKKAKRRRQNHYRLNGQTFEYADPPDNGTGVKVLPGQDVQCRCFGEPVFDDVLDMLDKLEAGETI